MTLLTASTVARLARTAAGSALGNARAATDVIGLARRDRAALAPSGSDLEPGDLGLLVEPECLRLLGSRSVGRLAYVARAGVPDIAPVNYALDGRDLLVRTGPGPKLQAAERREVVAFEVDDLDDDAHSGWSVVVVGRAERLSPDQAAAVAAPEPWSNGPRRHVVRIRPTRITGRRLG